MIDKTQGYEDCLPLINCMRVVSYLALIFLCIAGIGKLQAAESNPATETVFYENAVKVIFETKCIRCHNSKTKKAGLDLSHAEGILKGSESGRIVQAGNPDASLLLQMIDAEEMPPDEKDRLSKLQLEEINKWIAGGLNFREAVRSEPAVTQHDIVPLLHLRCVACHGGRRQEAGLDLRTKQSILKGGKSGPAVVPGKPNESLIIQRIKSGKMPPRRKLVSVSVKPMEATERELIEKWIALKLPEFKEIETGNQSLSDNLITDKDREFWSFKPAISVSPPKVKQSNRVNNPIDAFVLRTLEKSGAVLKKPVATRQS